MQKKTAIITFHRALNYGAVLQAFALEQALAALGVYAEVLDYRCPHIERIYRPFDTRHCKDRSSKIKKCIQSFWLVKKRRQFNQFILKRLHVSECCRTKADLQKTASEFEAVITGSDQVFNPEATGADYSYFLDFVKKDTKKIAYGASLGYNTFPEQYTAECTKYLRTFDAVSIREKSACGEVSHLTGKTVRNVLDPTLLLSREQWLGIARLPRRLPGKYVLVYMMEGCKYTIEKARAMANRKGCKLVLINPTLKQRLACRDFVMYSAASPEEFVGMFAEAEAVVTNSFHGAAFALIFQKEFYAEASNTQKAARIRDLLALFDLQGRLLPHSGTKELDWEKIRVLLLGEREKSISWLADAVNAE